MIANDGNIMEHAIPFDGSMDLDAGGNFGSDLTAAEWKGQLPTQAIAERYDIIVDFAPLRSWNQAVLRQHAPSQGREGRREQSGPAGGDPGRGSGRYARCW